MAATVHRQLLVRDGAMVVARGTKDPMQEIPLKLMLDGGYYLIKERLGSGGTGLLYQAQLIRGSSETSMALKLLDPRVNEDEFMVGSFERETRIMTMLDHPGIVQITGYGSIITGNEPTVYDGCQYIAMEHIEGNGLDKIIRSNRLRLDQTLRFAHELCGALAHVHSVRVVHRDVKPANVLVRNGTHEIRTKLIDFGIANFLGYTGEKLSRRSMGSVICGTAGYMAPEQIRDEPAGLGMDIYSTGIFVYEMLARRLPFETTGVFDLFEDTLHTEPIPLIRINSQVPRSLAGVVHKCIEKKPEERFQSMGELDDALTACELGRTVHPVAPRKHADDDSADPSKEMPANVVKTGKNDAERKKTNIFLAIMAGIGLLLGIVIGLAWDGSCQDKNAGSSDTNAPMVQEQQE